MNKHKNYHRCCRGIYNIKRSSYNPVVVNLCCVQKGHKQVLRYFMEIRKLICRMAVVNKVHSLWISLQHPTLSHITILT